jgi:hypothetical protein
MADPLSISASITALLDLTGKVIQYINRVRGAAADRQRILKEITSASGLLYRLQEYGEQAIRGDSWSLTLQSLNVRDGPLEQFKTALEKLISKLAPAEGLKKIGKASTWPFQEKEVKDILNTIERQKSLFSLALQNDHMSVSIDAYSWMNGVDYGQRTLSSHQRQCYKFTPKS